MSAPSGHYAFGPFRLDRASRQLLRDEHLVPLPPRAFDTLLVLVQHHDRVVEKDELLKTVWPDTFVSDDSLTQSIWTVRRALGDESAHPQFIATVPRRGYRFVAPVTVLGLPSDAAAAARSDRPPAAQAPADELAVAGARNTRPSAALWVGASAVALFALVAVAVWMRPAPEAGPGPVRLPMPAPEGTTLVSGAVVSPDGRSVVFVAQEHDSGSIRMWVRALDSGDARPLPGTDAATRPFWSPDSAAIGFFANGRLKTVDAAAGQPRTIATTGLNPGGGSWSADGVILYAGSRSGVFAVSETGERPIAVTTLSNERGDRAHRWPSFLPDGRRFLYTVVSTDPGRAGTYLGSLDEGEPHRRLFDTRNAFAAYAASGHILYVRDRTLMAQPFDPAAAGPTGTPVLIASNVEVPDFLNGALISGSETGVLTFGGGRTGGQLVWLDRAGRSLGVVDTPMPLHNPTLSADGRHLLADTSGEIDPDRAGVWQIDLERDARTRTTAGAAPLWSPDAAQVAYVVSEEGASHLYVRPAAGGVERRLLTTRDSIGLNDWSRDGRYIVYITTNEATKKDLWLMPTAGDAGPTVFLQTPFEELQGKVSPDGRWLAYTSDESGTWEVYVQSFPVPGTKHVVSTGGGGEPQWRADGRELFYLSPDNTMMSVAVSPGAAWQNSRPERLFKAPVAGDLTRYRTRYQVSRDGERFLVDSMAAGATERATVVVNWPALIEGGRRSGR